MTNVDPDGSVLLTSPEVGDLLKVAVEHAGGSLVTWALDHVDANPHQSTTATYSAIVDWPYGRRDELLGVSVVPQHSDARVLDQLIYKWHHSRQVIADVLCDKYADLMATGWVLEEDEIKRDVEKLFGGNFRTFLERKL